MNDYMNGINNIDDSGQLTLFTATEDSVEDLIYELLKDRRASTERAWHLAETSNPKHCKQY